jgi:hypothetical protein
MNTAAGLESNFGGWSNGGLDFREKRIGPV